MKVKLVVLLLLAYSFAAVAQESPKAADSSSFKMSTVFGKNHGKCNIPLGYFIETSVGYTKFGHHNVFLPGFSAGLILDHHWTMGMQINFIGNPHGLYFSSSHTDSAGTKHQRNGDLRGGYGGALFEYTLFPQKTFHVAFPLMVGFGSLYWSRVQYKVSNGTYTDAWQGEGNERSYFFVIEPGVRMELNMAKKFRLGLTVSYRYAPDLDLKYASENLVNQFTAKLSFR